MQIAAMTSHAALTASPRFSATMANATAPRRATAIHKTFVCRALELLTILMGRSPALQATPQTKFLPHADLDQDKKRRGQKNLHHHNVEEAWRTACGHFFRSRQRGHWERRYRKSRRRCDGSGGKAKKAFVQGTTARRGAPEEIRTPDPQIRSLFLSNSLTFLDFP